MLSRGARLCESIIRHSRAGKGGARRCGRPYLARRLGCSTRQVSRYVAELRDAGRLDVRPPRRERVADGWRTVGVNTYHLTRPANPAPHVRCTHNRRSGRDATRVTPSPSGPGMPGTGPGPGPLVDPSAAASRLLALLGVDRA